METSATARTETGHVRERNEDSFLVDGERGVYAIADGMGGRMGGDVASQILIETIRENAADLAEASSREQLEAQRREEVLQLLTSTLLEANREIYNAGQGEMGTTGDLLVLADRNALIAHVGDSRIYLLRAGEIQRLTADHTYAEEFLGERSDAPERDETFGEETFDHVLTRCLGVEPHVRIDTLCIDVRPGDRFLLCTDGVTNQVREQELLEMNAGAELSAFVDGIVEQVRDFGGVDNTTAVGVELDAETTGEFDEVDSLVTTRKIEILRGVEIFEELDDRTILKVLRYVYQQRFDAGEKLIGHGETDASLYIVVSGQAAVRRDGRELARVGAGDHIGEMALVDANPRSADVVATEPTVTLSISREDFFEMIDGGRAGLVESVLMNMLEESVGRLRETTDILLYHLDRQQDGD